MRTMLISLVLFCSLTQLAIATTPGGPKFGIHDSLNECGADRIYYCFVPERCTDQSMKANPISVGSMKEVKANDKIFDDCEALIRFHQYGKKRVRVSIESFQNTTKIQSIKFNQNIVNDPRTQFSCELENGKHVAKYTYRVIPNQKDTKTNREINLERDASNKLKCTFVSTKKVDDDNSILIGDGDDILFFTISPDKTIKIETKPAEKNTFLFTYDKPRCEPENFEYKFEPLETKLYTKVDISKPGEYSCPYRYKKEVVRDINSGYEEVNEGKIGCEGRKFKINGKLFNPDDKIEIRCVAEVEFFCDYNVKTLEDSKVSATKKKIIQKTPDFKIGEKTALECPEKHPHLIIVRSTEKAVLNAKINCVNYRGREPVFTIVDGMKISEKGPKVYCTNELKCHELNKITESQVKGGSLDQKTFQPICYERGKLKVFHKNTKEKVNRTRCDGSTGHFQYFIDKDPVPHTVNEKTEFSCEYARVPDTNTDQKNQKTIAIGSAVGIGLSVVVAIGLIVAAGYFASLRVKKENARIKQRERENKAAWKKYCWDKEEKAAYNEANDLDSEQSAEAPSELSNWSPMLMSFQYRAMAHMMNDAGTKLTHNQHEREKHKFEFEKTPENVLKCAQIYKCMVPGEETGKDTPERRMHETYSVPKAAKWWTNEKVFNKRKRRFDNIFAL